MFLCRQRGVDSFIYSDDTVTKKPLRLSNVSGFVCFSLLLANIFFQLKLHRLHLPLEGSREAARFPTSKFVRFITKIIWRVTFSRNVVPDYHLNPEIFQIFMKVCLSWSKPQSALIIKQIVFCNLLLLLQPVVYCTVEAYKMRIR